MAQLTYKEARKRVQEIKEASMQAPQAYKLSKDQAKELIEILKQFGNQINNDGTSHPDPLTPSIQIAFILINTIDKNVYHLLNAFFKTNPKIYPRTESLLRANMRRIAGF